MLRMVLISESLVNCYLRSLKKQDLSREQGQQENSIPTAELRAWNKAGSQHGLPRSLPCLSRSHKSQMVRVEVQVTPILIPQSQNISE